MERRFNPKTNLWEVWNGEAWIPQQYTIRYTSPEDRRLHLLANARNRGMPEGSLYEYEADRKAAARPFPVTERFVSFKR